MSRPPSHTVTFIIRPSGTQLVQVAGECGPVMRHAHRSVCITAMQNGVRRFSFMQDERMLMPGQVLVIAPDIVHSCGPCTVFSRKWCGDAGGVFDQSVAQGELEQDRQILYTTLCVPVEKVAFVRTCVLNTPELARMVCQLPHSSEARCIEQLSSMMEEGGADVSPIKGCGVDELYDAAPMDVHRALLAVESMVRTSDMPGTAFSLKVLAETCHADPDRLSRRFKSYVGMPPVAWHMLRRIQRAASLLKQGYGVTDSAYLAGFYDQSHFSHRFRQIMGMTPGQYLTGISCAEVRTMKACADE